MGDVIRAVAHGHAVSDLGYEVKLDRDSLIWSDGKHKLHWQAHKQKDGTLLILRKTLEARRHKHDAEGTPEMDARQMAVVEDSVTRALVVLHIKGGFG